MQYAFNNADAPDRKTRQYYEMFGNRAIYSDGWKAVTLHANRMPWDINVTLPFEQDVWELYNGPFPYNGVLDRVIIMLND